MHDREILAIVPARGGSKGIPLKNLTPLAGKPLLAHTLEQARAAAAITRCVVSTDHAGIAAVAREYGAEVIDRPAELSGDTASTESALVHVLDTLQAREGYLPDLIVLLQCTSPLRRPNDIDNAIRTLQDAEADALLSVVPFTHFLWHTPDGVLTSYNYDYRHRPRRQDQPPFYQENGSIYVFKPRVLRETGNRLGGKIVPYVMDPLTAVEIDTPADLVVIAALLAAGW